MLEKKKMCSSDKEQQHPNPQMSPGPHLADGHLRVWKTLRSQGLGSSLASEGLHRQPFGVLSDTRTAAYVSFLLRDSGSTGEEEKEVWDSVSG